MLVKQTPVYVLLIDASNACDRVSQIKLFNHLQVLGVCSLSIRVLHNNNNNIYLKSNIQCI